MEEILASIRRIIADDQTMPSRTSRLDPPAVIEAVRVDEEAPLPLRRGEPAPYASLEQREPSAPAPKPLFGEPRPALHEVERASVPRLVTPAPHIPVPERPSRPPEAGPSQEAGAHRIVQDRPPFGARSPVQDHFVQDQPFAQDPADDGGRAFEPPAPPERGGMAAEAPFAAMAERGDESPFAATRAGEPRRPVAPELFSAHTNQSVSSAFNMLAATRLADNSEELLGMVRDMIRPLLKTWIDDNLPTMVERLVRAEIERVARGGR